MTTTTQAPATQTEKKATIQPNQTAIVGNLGANAEVRYFENCSKTTISIAVNEPNQEKASWYAVVLWNLSEGQIKYLSKGRTVAVTGEMRFEHWTDKTTGENRRALKLHVNSRMGLQLLSRSNQTVTAPASAPKPVAPPVPVAAPESVAASAPAMADEEWDTIPFVRPVYSRTNFGSQLCDSWELEANRYWDGVKQFV